MQEGTGRISWPSDILNIRKISADERHEEPCGPRSLGYAKHEAQAACRAQSSERRTVARLVSDDGAGRPVTDQLTQHSQLIGRSSCPAKR